eukprot:CAMPEP_0119298720 /NCGR_PEP_ID=MMETSP1333-20130426/819_1 /TAXON_ID=418940 /ORGANISM="Scyphosphaera apsteinii, Strain RCC1455" /LENGTH=93 /DNA_ID=CAMNT_0007299907 /DNA_START=127 /DNA_END=404 /DNA_ORIENTATION=+
MGNVASSASSNKVLGVAALLTIAVKVNGQYGCVSGNTPQFDIEDGIVTVPNTVGSIADYAFYNCTSLKEVVIAESVESIGYGAFMESGLTSVT